VIAGVQQACLMLSMNFAVAMNLFVGRAVETAGGSGLK